MFFRKTQMVGLLKRLMSQGIPEAIAILIVGTYYPDKGQTFPKVAVSSQEVRQAVGEFLRPGGPSLDELLDYLYGPQRDQVLSVVSNNEAYLHASPNLVSLVEQLSRRFSGWNARIAILSGEPRVIVDVYPQLFRDVFTDSADQWWHQAAMESESGEIRFPEESHSQRLGVHSSDIVTVADIITEKNLHAYQVAATIRPSGSPLDALIPEMIAHSQVALRALTPWVGASGSRVPMA